MSEWKNTTSYQRGETGKELRSVTLSTGSLRIIVHKHIHYGNAWLVTCFDLKIEDKELGVESLEEAKAKALVFISQKLRGYLAEVEEHIK